MKIKMKQPHLSPDTLALYDKLIATMPHIERKGVKLPYTSVNGNMFSFLPESGSMALRLPPDAREAFLRKYKTTLVEAHGVIMKEYVTVPESLLKKTNELQKHLEVSYAYAKTLKRKTASLKKKRPPSVAKRG